MRRVSKVLIIVLLIPVLLGMLSLFLPAHYRVVRSVQVNARPEAIFTNINTPRTWPEWTAWTVERYPDMKVSFAGPDSGAGAVYSWEGRSSGDGTLKLTRSDPGRSVGFDLSFEQGQHLSQGAIVIEPAGDSVKVTWTNEGELGRNPVTRYFGMFMDKFMGPDLEKGLQNLKQRVELK